MPGLTRAQIMALMPHAGAMCLLDGVVDWDADHILCRSERFHCDHAHPLRHNGRLAGVTLAEYGAQAAAAHAGLFAQQAGQGQARQTGGFLAGLRDVQLPVESVDCINTALDIHAWREVGGPQGMIYRFEVASAGVVRATGRLTIAAAG